MISNILKILTLSFLLSSNLVIAQEIWNESFLVSEKGIWGSGGILQTDFTGITDWTLEYSDIHVTDAGDYAKTVATSGGRFEVVDINGEIVWKSKIIDISVFKNVVISLQAIETGSNSGQTLKYLKASYVTDNATETQFSINGSNAGNWGSTVAEQKNITGNTLQIIVRMSNSYSSDKVILDEIKVTGDKEIIHPQIPRYSIVFNELMVDPTPVVGLPETEFIELFNTLNYDVNVENWILKINGVEKKLQKATIQAGSFLILCATASLESLKQFGNAINVVGFQGLLNSGATVEIFDSQKNLIDRVIYSDTWYNDPKKNSGGWSLEKTDPERNCNLKENWQVSIDVSGGSPGKRNSVFRRNPDSKPPSIVWMAAISDKQIELIFSEPMDTTLLKDKINYKFGSIGAIYGIELISSENIRITCETQLTKDKTYLIEIKNLTDDCGNKIDNYSGIVQWNIPETGDLLINEILFNPIGNGEDYVEIYNNSQKIINIGSLFLATRDDSNTLKQVSPISAKNRQILPESYVAITKDTNKVFPFYSIGCRSCFIQTDKIPSYNNDIGIVVLLDKQQNILDEFRYDEKMHSKMIADPEGVSLERISFDEPAIQPGNWLSASSVAGYGTPGYKNSQSGIENQSKPRITFEPESFSPNNDGYNDEYIIHYQFINPGSTGSISVFDASGRYVMHLQNNQLLGTEDKIVWNGENGVRQKLPPGVYVILFEILDISGQIYRFKDGIVLTNGIE